MVFRPQTLLCFSDNGVLLSASKLSHFIGFFPKTPLIDKPFVLPFRCCQISVVTFTGNLKTNRKFARITLILKFDWLSEAVINRSITPGLHWRALCLPRKPSHKAELQPLIVQKLTLNLNLTPSICVLNFKCCAKPKPSSKICVLTFTRESLNTLHTISAADLLKLKNNSDFKQNLSSSYREVNMRAIN